MFPSLRIATNLIGRNVLSIVISGYGYLPFVISFNPDLVGILAGVGHGAVPQRRHHKLSRLTDAFLPSLVLLGVYTTPQILCLYGPSSHWVSNKADNVKTKNLPLARNIQMQHKVKKNLRGPPNNSLLQRPNDGPVHCWNARGANRHTIKNHEIRQKQFTPINAHI